MKNIMPIFLISLLVCFAIGCGKQIEDNSKDSAAIMSANGKGGGILRIPSKETSEAQSRTGYVAGCDKERILPNRYCQDHICTFEGCTNKRVDGSKYCNSCINEHFKPTQSFKFKDTKDIEKGICFIQGCKKRQKAHSNFCSDHGCSVNTCYRTKQIGNYCKGHAIEKETGTPYDDDLYHNDSYYYDDFEQFWEDYNDIFDSYDDAMDYWEEEHPEG